MNKNKLKKLEKAGEVYIDHNGDPRYTASNSMGKRAHGWAARPGSAPLMTTERSLVLNTIKKERREIEYDNALIRAAEAFSGERVESPEVAQGMLLEAVARKAFVSGSAANSKLVFQMTGAYPEQAAGNTNIETQNVLQIFGNAAYTKEHIDAVARNAPELLKHELETADWAGAEELQQYASKALQEVTGD